MRSWLVIPALVLPAACGPTIHPTFDSPEPAARNAAIVKAGADDNRAAIPDLIRMLESDDPATRLLAITALERMTGERNGFDYGAPPYERERGVQRWRDWLAKHPGSENATR
ncbi:MAG: HEAT repeat domain-containing protein [Planctomycetes bacterium]|nr:HEAT repeat domain-containing protein [Planctomycetota bacterium]